MDSFLFLIASITFVLLLIFSFFYGLGVIFLKRDSDLESESLSKQHWLGTLAEILFTLAAPITGFLRANGVSSEEYPFADEHLPTLIVLTFVAVLAYWVFRLRFDRLSPILSVLILIALVQGWLINLVLTLHFGTYVILGTLFPIIGYELTAPLVNIVFLARAIYLHHLLFCQKHQAHEGQSIFIRFLAHPSFMRKSGLTFILFFPFFFIQQIILTLFGQAPDATLRVFIESCKFNFSDNRYCPPPPEHYLCTIAAQGSPKLVKPLRPGYRGEYVIWINRQLMVANAFEEWLEEVAPAWQKKLRQFYDRLKIPVEHWCQQKWRANLFYCLMKPLEWVFLIWLYLVTQTPEQRIERQYLQKKYSESSTNFESL